MSRPLFSIIVVLSLLACASQTQENRKGPTLSAAQVRESAITYAKNNQLWANSLIVEQPIYVPTTDRWVVIFRQDSLVMGEGGFGIVITDDAEARISVQKDL